MKLLTTGRVTEAQGEVSILRDANNIYPWTQVSVNVFNAAGDAVDVANGTLSGKARPVSSAKFTDFTNTIDLSGNEWTFTPSMSMMEEYRFSVAGLNAGYTYEVTIANWGMANA